MNREEAIHYILSFDPGDEYFGIWKFIVGLEDWREALKAILGSEYKEKV